ncbi:hypothetical protein VCV18_006765 [Metarhizium anisopliae]
MPAPTYIISKIADPIFAVFIGISAAAMRINREEKAKGYTTQQTIDNGLRSPQAYRLVQENGMIFASAWNQLNACL